MDRYCIDSICAGSHGNAGAKVLRDEVAGARKGAPDGSRAVGKDAVSLIA